MTWSKLTPPEKEKEKNLDPFFFFFYLFFFLPLHHSAFLSMAQSRSNGEK